MAQFAQSSQMPFAQDSPFADGRPSAGIGDVMDQGCALRLSNGPFFQFHKVILF